MNRVSIKGEEHPIRKIFSDDFMFTIPLYQRPYAWTNEQAGELLEDRTTVFRKLVARAVEVARGSMKFDLVSAATPGRVLMAFRTRGLIEQGTQAGLVLEFDIEVLGTLLETGALGWGHPGQRIAGCK